MHLVVGAAPTNRASAWVLVGNFSTAPNLFLLFLYMAPSIALIHFCRVGIQAKK